MHSQAPIPGGGAGRYERFIRFSAGTMMAAIVVIMIAQVIARYVVGSSLIWAEELCRYILIWMTFLFAGYAYQRGELVLLDLFSSQVSPRTYLVLRLVAAVPVAALLSVVIWTGVSYALRFSEQIIPAVNFIGMSLTGHEVKVSVFWIYVAVPVGSAVLLAHFLARLALDAIRFAKGQPTAQRKHSEGQS